MLKRSHEPTIRNLSHLSSSHQPLSLSLARVCVFAHSHDSTTIQCNLSYIHELRVMHINDDPTHSLSMARSWSKISILPPAQWLNLYMCLSPSSGCISCISCWCCRGFGGLWSLLLGAFKFVRCVPGRQLTARAMRGSDGYTKELVPARLCVSTSSNSSRLMSARACCTSPCEMVERLFS